jgi:hypothetical protein
MNQMNVPYELNSQSMSKWTINEIFKTTLN